MNRYEYLDLINKANDNLVYIDALKENRSE
jgi:hypothetical protein